MRDKHVEVAASPSEGNLQSSETNYIRGRLLETAQQTPRPERSPEDIFAQQQMINDAMRRAMMEKFASSSSQTVAMREPSLIHQ
jgi:hypothetical protein